MKTAIVVHIEPNWKDFEEMAELTANLLIHTRKFPGCVAAHQCLAPDRNEISLFQVWENDGALDAYLTWRAENGDFFRVNELSANEQDFRVYSIADFPS